MSPRKLTEDDKQEILEQYRNSEATTSTLAKSFEVSSSTISRFLKNKLSTIEYEDLIQQKRLARTPRGEKSLKTKNNDSPGKTVKKAKTTKAKTKSKASTQEQTPSKIESKKVTEVISSGDGIPELTPSSNLLQDTVEQTETEATPRRRRRKSSITKSEITPEVIQETQAVEAEIEQTTLELEPATPRLVLDRVRSQTDTEDIPKSERLILKGDLPDADDEEDEDDEDDEMDLLALREILGEDLEDINDEEDEEEDWDDDDETPYPDNASNFHDLQILPLSEASLPRICYLVIDRSAELIIKPLAEFADLGAIPETEVSQATLPVFDNHRIAKRFSHRRERVIKVPDGRMLQKTSHHLQEKGITRLLIDGQIYSLSQ